MFDKVKDLYKLQKEAKKIKKELAKIHIEAEVDGITVIINGEQEIIDIKIAEEAMKNKKSLEENITKCFNKATKKAQQVAADKMKDVMGGLPGIG